MFSISPVPYWGPEPVTACQVEEGGWVPAAPVKVSDHSKWPVALTVTSFDEVAEEVTSAIAITGTTKVATASNFLKFVRMDLLYP